MGDIDEGFTIGSSLEVEGLHCRRAGSERVRIERDIMADIAALKMSRNEQ